LKRPTCGVKGQIDTDEALLEVRVAR